MARTIYALWFVLFLVAALLQYNDPDPWLWAPLYGGAAYCCYRFVRGLSLSPRLLAAAALGCALGGALWFTFHLEAVRAGEREPLYETSGLAIVAVTLASLAWLMTQRSQQPHHA
jgi:hypothetical protein